jgi:hypothetical protein
MNTWRLGYLGYLGFLGILGLVWDPGLLGVFGFFRFFGFFALPGRRRKHCGRPPAEADGVLGARSF